MPFYRCSWVALATVFLFFQGCVGNKVYRAELSMREQCEAREKVLVQQQLDRRKETADLTKQVGDLNRTIGNQETEIKDLKEELSSRTQQLGESSTKLITEKNQLEKDLAAKNATLAKREATLQSIASAQKGQQKILNELKDKVLAAYPPSTGTMVEIADQAVVLTLPDAGLFDATGQTISPAGKALLTPLAGLLADQPDLDVEVLAYTDNILPKGAKNLADTWDWSLARATNLVRLLIRDFNTNANQLTPVAKGEFYPLTSNETPEGRAKNRRTVLVIRQNLPRVPLSE